MNKQKNKKKSKETGLQQAPSVTEIQRSPERAGLLLRFLPLVTLWALPLVAILVAVPLSAALDEASVAAPEATSVFVGSRQADRATAVTAVVTQGESPEIRLATSGTVTALYPLETIAQGTPVLAVDGVPVLAYRGPVLYRDLARGDKGADVAAVAAYLTEIGLLSAGASSETFGTALRTAVRSLQAQLGVAQDGMFRLSYVAYIPSDAITFVETAVKLGQSVATGDVVLRAAAPTQTVTFRALAVGATLAQLANNELILRLPDREISVASVELTGEAAVVVAAELAAAAVDGSARIEAGESGESSTITYSGGVLALRESEVVGVVSATALVIEADGTSCLLVLENATTASTQARAYTLKSAVPANDIGTVAVDEATIGLLVVRDASSLPKVQQSCD